MHQNCIIYFNFTISKTYHGMKNIACIFRGLDYAWATQLEQISDSTQNSTSSYKIILFNVSAWPLHYKVDHIYQYFMLDTVKQKTYDLVKTTGK